MILSFLLLAVQVPSEGDLPERRVAEDCVWEHVQTQVKEGAPTADIDARLAMGRRAVENCDAQIVGWAMATPGAFQSLSRIGEVSDRARLHLINRGASFAEGTARRYYLEKKLPQKSKAYPPAPPAPRGKF